MNKSELVKELACRTGFTQKDSGKFLDALTETIGEVVATGDDVAILGFGSFYLKRRDARKGLSFGKECYIPASRSVGFKAGKGLKDAVK